MWWRGIRLYMFSKKIKVKRYIIPDKISPNAKEHNKTSIILNMDEIMISIPY